MRMVRCGTRLRDKLSCVALRQNRNRRHSTVVQQTRLRVWTHLRKNDEDWEENAQL